MALQAGSVLHIPTIIADLIEDTETMDKLFTICEDEFYKKYQHLYKVSLMFQCMKCNLLTSAWDTFKLHVIEKHPHPVEGGISGCITQPEETISLPPKKNKLVRIEIDDNLNKGVKDGESANNDKEVEVMSVKRGRGRPRKEKPLLASDKSSASIKATDTFIKPTLRTRSCKNKSMADSTPVTEDPINNKLYDSTHKVNNNDKTDLHKKDPSSDLSAILEDIKNSEMQTNDEAGSDTEVATEGGNVTVEDRQLAMMGRRERELLKALTCPFCTTVLSDLSQCLPHYKEAHNYTPKLHVKCDTAEPVVRKEGDVSKAQCKHCCKLISQEKLELHVILVHVWRNVKRLSERKQDTLCDICGKTFKYVHNMTVHRRLHTNPQQRPPRQRTMHYCDLCDYKTPESSRLKVHVMSQHQDNAPYKCPKCPFKTHERSTYRTHLYRHSSEKRFKCTVCSYQCIQIRQLRQHLQKQHSMDLPKKYEVTFDEQGKRKVKRVDDSAQQNIKVNKVVILPKLTEFVEHGDKAADLAMVQSNLNEDINTYAEPREKPQRVSGRGVAVGSVYVEQAEQTIYQQHTADTQPQILDDTFKSQEIVEDAGGTSYMLLYPSSMSDSTYTAVPQAETEVLVTTQVMGEQLQYQHLKLAGPMTEQQTAVLTEQQVMPHPGATMAQQLMPSYDQTVTSVVQHMQVLQASTTAGTAAVNTYNASENCQIIPPTSNHTVSSLDANYVLPSQQPVNEVSTYSTHQFIVADEREPVISSPDPDSLPVQLISTCTTTPTTHMPLYIQSDSLLSQNFASNPPGGSECTDVNYSGVAECRTVSDPGATESSIEQDIARTLIQINPMSL